MAKKKYVDEFYLFNVKKLREFEAKVKGRHFAMVGPNGAGKTTVFQAIRRLIASLPEAQKPEVWITKGEEAAEMKLKLVDNGDVYWVQEKITKAGRSRIRLFKETTDGRRDELTPAQTRLVEIFGNVLDLTPLIDMSGKEQFAFLKNNIGIDTSKYDNDRRALVKTRDAFKGKKTLLNAIMKDQQVTEADVTTYADVKDVEVLQGQKVVIKILENAMIAAQNEFARIEDAKSSIPFIEQQIKKLQEEKANLEEIIKTEGKVIKNLDDINKQITAAATTNAKLDEEIKTASDHNVKHTRVVYYLEKKKEIESVNKDFDDYAAQVKQLDKSFYEKLAALPFDKDVMKGLKLMYQPKDEDTEEKIGLFLEDLPFNRRQLSYGIMIKALIKMAVQLNPDGLNFVYISDWNLLDTANQNDLLEFAEEQENVQLGIEKVDDKTEVSVEFIEIKDRPKKGRK